MREREVLFSSSEIEVIVNELAEKINSDYKDKNLLVVCLLKGAFIFTSDLVRKLDINVVLEFMTTSSYADSEISTGDVKVLQDLTRDITEFDVLIVDDIIDTGNTMKFVYNLLKSRNPKSIKTCTLLDKPSRRKVEFECDYCGRVIEDKFIVGYGLNYYDHYRNVDHIFAFKSE